MYTIIIILLLCNFFCINGWIHPLESYCELKCGKYENTMCKQAKTNCQPTQSTCTTLKFSDDFRQGVLDVHNYYRNYIASGQEKLIGFTVPDMMYIKYDEELAEIAQCHANNCIDTKLPETHDKCRRSHKFQNSGQNIHHDYYFKFDPEILNVKTHIFTHLKNGWYGEVKFTDPSNYGEDQYVGKHRAGFEGKDIGHFAQFVNAKSDHIGCGWACNERVVDGTNVTEDKKFHYVLVCNYAGYVKSKGTVIKPGKPCSQCPPDKPCLEGSKYPALCGMVKLSPDAVGWQSIGMTIIINNRVIYLLTILWILVGK